MTKRHAFLVLGPESSGTRLATSVLIAGGCVGDADHVQRWDSTDPIGETPIVWRRSIPHDNEIPALDAMLARLDGYSVTPVVVVRDWSAVVGSRLAKREYEASAEDVIGTIQFAYAWTYEQLALLGLDEHDVVVYESLLLRPDQAQRALWSRLGLPGGEPVVVTDEDAKHMEAA